MERARDAALVATLEGGGRHRRARGHRPRRHPQGARREHRAERLVVSKGYTEQGWRVPGTGALALVGPRHPDTGAPMERVEDVVEDAIEEAISQGVPVTICVADADLDVMGRIGALLRY